MIADFSVVSYTIIFLIQFLLTMSNLTYNFWHYIALAYIILEVYLECL